jgi:hypothetical protein
MELFPSSGECWKTPSLFGPLERDHLNHWITGLRVALTKGPKREDVLLPSPQDGKR